MKVRSHILSPAVVRGIAVLCAAVFVASAPSTARAAGVVGTGGAASCTDAALNAALAGGGVVTFNCGNDPVTIDISAGTGTKTIAADTTVDGGGMVTISGGNTVLVFSVDAGVTFTVKKLLIADGGAVNVHGGGIFNGETLVVTGCIFTANNGGAGGGGIYNSSGSLTVTDTIFTANSAHTVGSGGGAIYNGIGTATVTNCTFNGNIADGGFAGPVVGGDLQ